MDWDNTDSWRNAEYYPDHTAAEAIRRVMGRGRDISCGLNDENCCLLVQAIVRQAAEDYLSELKRASGRTGDSAPSEAESFFRSAYFRRLTGLNGNVIIRLIRKEAGIK